MFTLRPANADYFERLFVFAKKIFSLCASHDIHFLVYGSLAHFYYTKDSSLTVNDIDMMIAESDYPLFLRLLKEHQFTHTHNACEIFIREGDLLVEVDYIGLGNVQLENSLSYQIVDLYGQQINLVTLESLESIYSLARLDKNNTDSEKIEKKILHLENFLKRAIHS